MQPKHDMHPLNPKHVINIKPLSPQPWPQLRIVSMLTLRFAVTIRSAWPQLRIVTLAVHDSRQIVTLAVPTLALHVTSACRRIAKLQWIIMSEPICTCRVEG